MAQIHADPEALRKQAHHQRSFAEELEMQQRHLRTFLEHLQNTWRDDRYHDFTDALLRTLDRLASSATQLNELSRQLEAIAAPLEGYLGTSAFSNKISSSVDSTSAQSSTDSLRKLTSKRGLSLTWLPIASLASAEIDWGISDFGRRFQRDKHHGYTGRDYLTLAAQLPVVLRHLKNSGSLDQLPPESPEKACYDAFFGDHPIRLERISDDRFNVIDGRHRLYACLQLGINPPVSLIQR